jgi:hypothetical protein
MRRRRRRSRDSTRASPAAPRIDHRDILVNRISASRMRLEALRMPGSQTPRALLAGALTPPPTREAGDSSSPARARNAGTSPSSDSAWNSRLRRARRSASSASSSTMRAACESICSRWRRRVSSASFDAFSSPSVASGSDFIAAKRRGPIRHIRALQDPCDARGPTIPGHAGALLRPRARPGPPDPRYR